MMRAVVVAVAAAALAGCATSKVSLYPDTDGTTGAVAVLDAKSEAEVGALNQPNTWAKVGGKTVQARPVSSPHTSLMAWMPPPPRVYLLYFIEGTADLTAESGPTLEALRQAVTAASEVQITGHTDTVGSSESNDGLSRDRATEIRAALVKRGLPVENAKVVGRGEREPRVKTADGVDEPGNRRVEVVLR
jgi:outer membrane protein OmpA-like peptidoglycan-associated protein